MNIRAEIQYNGRPNASGFKPVRLLKDDGSCLCQLDVTFSNLASLTQTNSRAIDFLLLAAVVYSMDKKLLRKTADDSWTRNYSLMLPVSDVEAWRLGKSELDSCLSFLTGDVWDVNYYAQTGTPIEPVQQALALQPTANAVCLFSGGLDSLIGAIDWLSENTDGSLVAVGHYDEQMKGPKSDQEQLLPRIQRAYPDRFDLIQVRIGHRNDLERKSEITLRSRSLVFIALGVYVASALGRDVPMLIPENGTIALNVPLSPSRRGSCSTRTAHPYYLVKLRRILTGLGVLNAISNPLEEKTKGEAVSQCLNPQLLNELARLSVSCAKRGHRRYFTNRDAKSCGRCMPCIYRRAALHTIGLDNELYGDNFCTGDVNINANGIKPNDLRACLAFLKNNASLSEISSLLMTNGSLDATKLPAYSMMVQRAMSEIRNLLRDKATTEIKRLAGL
ncbi:Qat anti-phage system QueC-like protein QatC [Geotalea sp. SG265]|uniref:Qat anti-phage system QueC-like protein QatC n=1 Tax=Geotalea sp. SG265 TaxID=2922867 RepID=UPI001FAE889C|nr:Qat anti-phage system QueC-like protein QatC [Geotalea sp. SG265]